MDAEPDGPRSRAQGLWFKGPGPRAPTSAEGSRHNERRGLRPNERGVLKAQRTPGPQAQRTRGAQGTTNAEAQRPNERGVLKAQRTPRLKGPMNAEGSRPEGQGLKAQDPGVRNSAALRPQAPTLSIEGTRTLAGSRPDETRFHSRHRFPRQTAPEGARSAVAAGRDLPISAAGFSVCSRPKQLGRCSQDGSLQPPYKHINLAARPDQ
jgi:hypothetical protein